MSSGRQQRPRPQQAPSGEPEFLTLAELAAYMHVHPSSIYRMLRAHKLPGFKVGHRDWRFNRKAIEQWMRSEAEQLQRKRT